MICTESAEDPESGPARHFVLAHPKVLILKCRAFLTLHLTLHMYVVVAGAVGMPSGVCMRQTTSSSDCVVVKDNPSCDWAVAKAKIRTQVGEIPFLNWFEPTRQIERQGAEITIAVSDEPSRSYLEAEYGTLIRMVLADLGIHESHLTVAAPGSRHDETIKGIN
jgi:hypothetical protein